jgi:glucose-1-phosphate cytidylyltransferase
MKVVLFCGGHGMRMREYSEVIPKPMVQIGYRPILWHLMNYYAHYGHKDFILCLGYRADAIKSYFLQYDECVSNDFVLSGGGQKVELLHKDIDDWKITFVDTGLNSNIGQRLLRVRRFVEDDEMFLANYADGLSDLPLDIYIENFLQSNKTACFIGVKPTASFHIAKARPDGTVEEIEHITTSGHRVNGGFFALRHEIFDYINEGEEMVEQPFRRLIAKRQLITYQHDAFWACMDTFKERQYLDDLYTRGDAPWQVWKQPSACKDKAAPRGARSPEPFTALVTAKARFANNTAPLSMASP